MGVVMDRQELYALLGDAMRGTLPQGVAQPMFRPGKVKSRLIEGHPPEPSSEGALALLMRVAERSGSHVAAVGDDLFVLRTPDDAYFVDTLNSRFWLIYTTASADRLASLMRTAFLSQPALDSAWLPAAQLDALEGERQWIKSSFAADQLDPGGAGREGSSARRWRVQVEGDEPQELLQVVRQQLPNYAAATSLTAVGSLVDGPGASGQAFIIADYRGSFISSGESFEAVAGTLWRFVDRYERYITTLEHLYRLQAVALDGVGLSVDGDVAVISLPRPIADLRAFIGGLFDCRDPFRLWAVPREVAEGEWEANAVDLHVGHTLRLEITDRWIRILLDSETCGNTLARLVANLQHHFHAQTELAYAS
jgi:hypothetical protein